MQSNDIIQHVIFLLTSKNVHGHVKNEDMTLINS